MMVVFASVNIAREPSAPSRPSPERLYPPKAVRRSRTMGVFTITVPVRSPEATRSARSSPSVQT